MKDWKTTLFGALAAVCAALALKFPDYKELLAAISAVFLALMGFFAGDKKNETQTKTDPAEPPKG